MKYQSPRILQLRLNTFPPDILFAGTGASVAQAPFPSENVGSVFAMDSRERSQYNSLPKVVGFLRVLRYPPTGKVDRAGYTIV
jgi:hypothetical protein